MFLNDTKFFESSVLERNEAKLCFFQGQMCNVDEYKRDRESTLTYLEFLEALCRLADASAHNELREPLEYDDYDLAESLTKTLGKLLPVLAEKHKARKGCLFISCKGHSMDGKKAADLSRFLPQRKQADSSIDAI